MWIVSNLLPDLSKDSIKLYIPVFPKVVFDFAVSSGARIYGGATRLLATGRSATEEYRLHGLIGVLSDLERELITVGDKSEFGKVVHVMTHWKYTEPAVKETEPNPHPLDNATRANAEKLIQACADQALPGRPVYWVQKGEAAKLGSSMLYDPVDVSKHDKIPEDCTFALVDVDYYINLAQYLSYFRSTFIYTFSPEEPCKCDDTHWFYFEGDQLHFKALGGHECVHKLWRYPADYLYVSPHWWSNGYWYRVKRLSYPRNRALIYLHPHCVVPWFLKWLAVPFMNRYESDLRRLKVNYVVDGREYTAFRTWTKDGGGTAGPNICFSRAGPHAKGYTLPEKVVNSCIDAHRALKGEVLAMHNVTLISKREQQFALQDSVAPMQRLPELDTIHSGKSVRVAKPSVEPASRPCSAASGCSLHTSDGDKDKVEGIATTPDVVNIIEKLNVGVTPVAPCSLEDSKLCSPNRAKTDVAFAIQKRVVEVQKKAEMKVDAGFVLAHQKDFIDELEKRGYLSVTRMTDVEAIDRSPVANRRAMKEGVCEPLGPQCRRPKVFIKGEGYPDLKDPRIITPVHPAVQSRLYAYVYPLQDRLHDASWFGFGRPPAETASWIATLTSIPELVAVIAESDFSRYDGSLTRPLRRVEEAIYERAYPNDVLIKELLTYTQDLVGPNGEDLGTARPSGEAGTCLMNSYLTMFVMFCAIGPTCFARCVVGGDDGISLVSEEEASAIEAASSRCGLTVKCVIRKMGEPFSFLGRFFTWGNPNSTCDPYRTLPKLHIVCTGSLDPKYHNARYLLKLKALLTSDANTPMLGHWLRGRISKWGTYRSSHIKVPDSLRERDWKYICGFENGNWPNDVQSWAPDWWAKHVALNGDKFALICQ
jgi:hypothetical protein